MLAVIEQYAAGWPSSSGSLRSSALAMQSLSGFGHGLRGRADPKHMDKAGKPQFQALGVRMGRLDAEADVSGGSAGGMLVVQ